MKLLRFVTYIQVTNNFIAISSNLVSCWLFTAKFKFVKPTGPSCRILLYFAGLYCRTHCSTETFNIQYPISIYVYCSDGRHFECLFAVTSSQFLFFRSSQNLVHLVDLGMPFLICLMSTILKQICKSGEAMKVFDFILAYVRLWENEWHRCIIFIQYKCVYIYTHVHIRYYISFTFTLHLILFFDFWLSNA